MAKVTMTLYEALTRKKNYEERLNDYDLSKKAIFGYYTKNKPMINGCTLEDAEKILKSNFDTFMHLKSNILNLQIAINKANLENTIVIPGYNNDEPITLVEAITQKQKLADRNRYINVIARKLEDASNQVKSINDHVMDPDYVYQQISKVSQSDAKKGDDRPADISRLMEDFREKNTAYLFDPNKIIETDWVQKQRTELDNFDAHLHTVLTKANTEIVIEVDLED